MPKLRNLIFISGFISALFAGAPVVYAQLSAVPDPVQYLIAPETPAPGQQVTITAQGVGGFLGSATVTWIKDGKVALTGVGQSNFAFTAGALGTPINIQVRIVSTSNGTITHDFVFLPSIVNLIWEADTSAPPLYRGKSLYSAGSTVKVVAFPTVVVKGTRIASNALTLQWSLQDTPMPNVSGLGRTSFSFVGDQLQAQEAVEVDVYYGASKVAHGAVNIPTSQPLVLFYDRDPLRGTIFDSAMPSAVSLSSKEITLQAVPYFFANSSLKNRSVSYDWTLNGEAATGPDSAKGILTLRQAGAGQGAAQVGVTLQNTESDKFVQTADAILQLVFGQSSGSTLFGL